MTRRITFLFVFLVTVVVLCALVELCGAEPCGSERALVKLGLDREARDVSITPRETTLAELVGIRRPAKTPEAHRADATERTIWRVSATLIGYKREADQDLHLVLSDEHGATMIVEIPAAACAADGAWAKQIAAARKVAEAKLPHATGRLRAVQIPVTVTGPAFWDRLHGQEGAAPTGLEIHPVIGIEIGGGA